MDQEKLDELLELCWVLEEKGKLGQLRKEQLNDEFKIHQPGLCDDGLDALELLPRAIELGLLEERGGKVSFLSAGRERAGAIVRRHRLAEKLFTDVLALPYTHSEEAACKFEHILSEEVTDSVCSFLGHPPQCPHGKAIPRGRCCRLFVKEVQPIVMPLAELNAGKEARIVFISSLHPQRLQKLSSMGVIPGCKLSLIQKSPSFVIQVDEMQVALDPEIVSEIYVRKGGENGT